MRKAKALAVAFGAAALVVTGAPAAVAKDNKDQKDRCKNGGYAQFGFQNQGQCISFVNHGGTLPPEGGGDGGGVGVLAL